MITPADSLELKNGSLIKGRFLGGTDMEIRFQVGSSVQRYEIADVVSLKFESETRVSEMPSKRDHANETTGSVTCRRERGFPCGPSILLIRRRITSATASKPR
jgi:hypothetical protein